MMKSWIICASKALPALALVSVGLSQPVLAGTFERNPAPGQERSIAYLGTIQVGDAAKLERVIASRLRSRHVETDRIFVNLDGGNLLESMKVADIMTARGMDIVVAWEDHCISACLNLFVGASKRWFTTKSYIGVHAALIGGDGTRGSGKGVENEWSRSATLAVAEIWTRYGVPANVIVKMLSTKGHDITWLKTSDLVENNWAEVFYPPESE